MIKLSYGLPFNSNVSWTVQDNIYFKLNLQYFERVFYALLKKKNEKEKKEIKLPNI